MAKASDILGMNARNQHYRSLNSSRGSRRANSKLLTKTVLDKAGVPVPKLYTIISDQEELKNFNFSTIETSFVIKPTGGSGGRGILVVRKKLKDNGSWLDWDGQILDESDLRLHVGDIIEGQYSTFGTKHRAFVEERVPLHPKLKKYVHQGTPDLRILVFNSVPVMAMLRLPTKDSGGKANLHLGGIGVGIDIATGITLFGVKNGKRIRYLPGTKTKLNGIKIPLWNKSLEVAVSAAKELDLAYSGVDLLLHPDKGPMVIELNAAPGLDIQIANRAGLRFRLDKVEGLKIRNTEHGVRVGKALFAESFADKVKAQEGVKILQVYENIQIKDSKGKLKKVRAMVDTRGYRSKIDRSLAKELGLLDEQNVLWKKSVGRNVNEVVTASFWLNGRQINTGLSVINRESYKNKILLGRLDLQGFLINPQKED
jgi:alpha-L-glutamate ligase-like protein